MQDHRKLWVWQRAQELCVEVYLLSVDFPVEERYGLTGQVRRAAVAWGATSLKDLDARRTRTRRESSTSRKAKPQR